MKTVTSKFSAAIAGAVTTALVAVSTGTIVASSDDGVIKL
jgi:hypothetical protein